MYDISDIKEKVITAAALLPIDRVILVGSYAKNEADENSDIDLVIEGKDLSEAYWDLLFALEDTLNIKVDLMTLRGLKNSCLKESILENGVVIYEA